MLSHFIKQNLSLHLSAIAVVLLLAVIGYFVVPRIPVRPPYDGLYIPMIAGKEVGPGDVATENLVRLNSALSSGTTLVVLGSSELQDGLHFVPYNFLPQSLHIPVLAYGYSFFQSLGLYGMLAANADALSPKTKLVLMLSPSWFELNSMPSRWFLANFRSEVLVNLYHRPQAREIVEQYIQAHDNEFYGGNTAILEGFSGNTEFYMDSEIAKQKLYSIKTRIRMLWSDEGARSLLQDPPPPVLPSPADWQKYQDAALQMNERWAAFGTNPDTTKYIAALPQEDLDKNGEFKMLERTVALLQSKDVHALIVLQPLNPANYKDASNVHVLGTKIAELLRGTDMQFYDMSDVPNYTQGTLRDSMHLGEYGWAEADQRIVGYYYTDRP